MRRRYAPVTVVSQIYFIGSQSSADSHRTWDALCQWNWCSQARSQEQVHGVRLERQLIRWRFGCTLLVAMPSLCCCIRLVVQGCTLLFYCFSWFFLLLWFCHRLFDLIALYRVFDGRVLLFPDASFFHTPIFWFHISDLFFVFLFATGCIPGVRSRRTKLGTEENATKMTTRLTPEHHPCQR